MIETRKTYKWKLSKYKDLKIEISRMRHLKTISLPIVIEALAIIPKSINKNMDQLPGCPKICKLQKILYSWLLLTSSVDISECSEHNYIIFFLSDCMAPHLFTSPDTKKCCLWLILGGQLVQHKIKVKHNHSDRIAHSWLSGCLFIVKIVESTKNSLKNSMRKWKTVLTIGRIC